MTTLNKIKQDISTLINQYSKLDNKNEYFPYKVKESKEVNHNLQLVTKILLYDVTSDPIHEKSRLTDNDINSIYGNGGKIFHIEEFNKQNLTTWKQVNSKSDIPIRFPQNNNHNDFSVRTSYINIMAV